MADLPNTTNAPAIASLVRGILALWRLRLAILYYRQIKLPLTARRCVGGGK